MSVIRLNRLQALLYTLMRDHVVPGELEVCVRDQETHPGPYEFSNQHLAAYALELAKRILTGPSDAGWPVDPKLWVDPQGKPWELVRRAEAGELDSAQDAQMVSRPKLDLRRGSSRVVDFEEDLLARGWKPV